VQWLDRSDRDKSRILRYFSTAVQTDSPCQWEDRTRTCTAGQLATAACLPACEASERRSQDGSVRSARAKRDAAPLLLLLLLGTSQRDGCTGTVDLLCSCTNRILAS